ncbi:MAG: lysophospholipid acyltransferase family protein [Candidatus Omnitrophica bacterium]|nr:lysophospholipid acyltransferase family protein [Candidatus Omnitrophota bacterium]
MFIFDHIIFYRIGRFLAEHLPVSISYFIAVIISDVHYFFAHQDRKEVFDNLKVIFPYKSKKEIATIRRKLFRNFAKYLVDFFRFSKLDREYIRKKIQVENIEYLKEALSYQKGIVALTAHFGNWELGGILMAIMGFPIWAVALPHRDRRVDEFFNFQREKKGLKVIPLEEATKRALELLRQNKLVAILGDRDFTSTGIILDFFQKPTLFPLGPAIFSLRTGAPIVSGFIIRKYKDYFILRFEKPIYPPQNGNLKENIRILISQYKNIFERYIRRYPDQWYMFRKFWFEK